MRLEWLPGTGCHLPHTKMVKCHYSDLQNICEHLEPIRDYTFVETESTKSSQIKVNNDP